MQVTGKIKFQSHSARGPQGAESGQVVPQSYPKVSPVQVPLSHQTDIAGFHGEATRLLAQQVPPETVQWSAAEQPDVTEEKVDSERASIRSRAARAIIPQSFVRMSELVVLHRDPLRFDLLYRSLWRRV